MTTTGYLCFPCVYREGQISRGLQKLNRESLSEQAKFWRELAAALNPDDTDVTLPVKMGSDFLGRYFDSSYHGSFKAYEETVKIFDEHEELCKKLQEVRQQEMDGESPGRHSGIQRMNEEIESIPTPVIDSRRGTPAMSRQTSVSPREIRVDGKLHFNGMLHLLGTHYGLAPLKAACGIRRRGNFIAEGTELPYFQQADHEMEYAALEKLWNLASSDGNYISKESFDYILRRLRIGWMMAHCQDEIHSDNFGEIFHYDYNSNKLSGSMTSREEGLKHWLWRSTRKFHLGEQIAVGDPMSPYASAEEFLYDAPGARGGDVHWIHLHQPSNALLVMMGQMYGLGIHCLSVLCRLGTTQTNSLHSKEWKMFTFPEVHLEKRARDSIRAHMDWKYHQEEDMDPPEIFIEAFTQNICFCWHEIGNDGAEEDRNYHTFISATAKPSYLGHWSTKVYRGISWQKLFLACCSKRRKAHHGLLQHREEATEDETQPLTVRSPQDTPPIAQRSYSSINSPADLRFSPTRPQGMMGTIPSRWSMSSKESHDDLEAGMEQDENDQPAMGVMLSQAFDTEQSQFNEVFWNVLTQLAKDDSALRMGDHRQLVFWILLDRSKEYVETVRLYTAAIDALQYYLKDPNAPDKDIFIAKITHAKLQLQTLVRMVKPFFDGVLMSLVEEGIEAAQQDSESFSSRLRRANVIDVDHNLKTFLERAHAQIQLCDLSIAQYDCEASDKGNSILNFLAVVTFLVTPVQVVTGWYGMNFIHMPELKWTHGYHYCILLCSVLFLIFFAVLRVKAMMT